MSTATEMRDLYLAAEAAVLKHQSFEIAGRTVTKADLPEIIAGRREWEQRVRDEAAAVAGRTGPMRYSAADFSGRS